MKKIPIDFMKGSQHSCTISFDVQNNNFNKYIFQYILFHNQSLSSSFVYDASIYGGYAK